MVKDIKRIERKDADDELTEELVVNAIVDLSHSLRFSKWENNQLTILTKLKQLVDKMYFKYGGVER